MPSIRDVTFWIWYTPDIKIKQNFLQIQHTSLKNLICWKIIIEALIYRHPRWEVTWSYSVWPNSNCHFFASWCQCRCSQNKTNAVQVSAAVTGKKHYIWGPKYWQQRTGKIYWKNLMKFSFFWLIAQWQTSGIPNQSIGTFKSEDKDEYQYEFSILSMRIRFGDRHFSKCACSEQKTCTRSHPRPPI